MENTSGDFALVDEEKEKKKEKESFLDVPQSMWTDDHWAGWAAFETQNRKEWEEEKRNNA